MTAPPPQDVPALALSARGLVKRWGEVEAVKGISFDVPRGQVVGLLGPNGAGKSTTLKMLAGVTAPTAGSIEVAGHDLQVAPLEAKRRLGFVPETGALYGLLSAREHLALASDLHELDPAWAAERTERLVEALALAEHADKRIDTLSKGNRRKVALAVGLLHDPEVVLLDEPLEGLDVHAARALKALVQGLAARGRTIIYCSHVLEVVERLCQRAIIIHGGRVVADAPTAELVGRSRDASLETVFHELTRVKDLEGLAEAFLDGPARPGAAT